MQEKIQTFYHILPNGIKIVHRWTPSPVAYIGVMVGAGTRDELPEENGMAHYIEHCVFKGTEHHTARQIIGSVEGIGGEMNAYTTKEETTFYAAITTEHIQLTLHLIAEMLLEPAFRKEETDKERMVILDEIESYNDSPSELIYDDFEGLLFAGTPLARPILGTRKTLRHLSSKPEYARRWMAEHYRPERMVVFCQGDVKPERVFRLAEKEFGHIPPSSTKDESATLVSVPYVSRMSLVNGSDKEERETRYKKHTHQIHAMVGNKAYPLGHKNQLAMFLLNNILGGGSLNSRLNLSLREAKGLVYTVESNYTPLSDTGYWCIYWACDPEDYQLSLQLVQRELDKLCSTRLSESALKRALQQLRGQMAISAQNQENTALAMAKSMLYFNQAPSWHETFRKIECTTSEQLQQISKEVLNATDLYTLTYE
ncbi:MAG: insulinase family protein [Paludibacteraceae bacterium]|nr:insulinase family protein [Paludibacteraceae bacterium]